MLWVKKHPLLHSLNLPRGFFWYSLVLALKETEQTICCSLPLCHLYLLGEFQSSP